MKGKSMNNRNKIPGLAYAVTDAGLELPVIDITHPLFTSTITEDAFKTERLKAVHKAERMRNFPSFIFEGMKITGVAARLIGLDRFKALLEKTDWMLDEIKDDGTMYYVFSLRRRKPGR
jgi:hypothetical protein